MTEPAPTTDHDRHDHDRHDNDRYEQACNQAIAMCDGNLRSTIKALIMANEYLEAEMLELQSACCSDHPRDELPMAKGEAA